MIKYFFSLFLFLFSLNYSATAQSISHQEMMQDNSYNFYEVVKEANTYFDQNGRGKGSGWKNFERWRNENESKYAPSGNRYNVDHYMPNKAYAELHTNSENLKTKSSFADGWVELGPWDANNRTSHYSPGIGRVETFWVNPADDNHMFVGSRSGGFWKTTDGGSTWENTTDFLVASGVRSIAVNPLNIDEILISVQHGGSGYSHGIYRSIDGGDTWTITNFNPTKLNWGGLGDNERIYKIAYHPTTAGQVFVGSTQGLYMSTDNLSTWTRPIIGWVTDIAFHPTDANTIYSYRYSGGDRNYLKKSTNGGTSFSNAGEFLDNGNSQIYLSTSAAEPNHIYAASSKNVYKSSNKGVFFIKLGNPSSSCHGGFSVSDTDVKNMIYGYVDLYASTNGGSSFIQKTKWATQDATYIHADVRTTQCLDGVFYVGTDGYFAKSTNNGDTWTILNDGTAIREYYAVGLSQGDYDLNMAGSQDNGTSILNKDGWIEWNGGDGMEALVHPLNSDWMIGSWQYGTRSYTRNGGLSRPGTGNPDRGSGNANWEAPLLQNPWNDMEVYHFSDSVFLGKKFGTEWSYVGSPNIGIITDAAIAESNAKVIACSQRNRLQLSLDGGETWARITNNLPTYSITDIAFDPQNENTIVVTYNRFQNDGEKVFITYNQGATWENITYNLGKMPLRTVVMDHSDSAYIYVGGEIGIYYKSKTAKTWTLYDNKLPNVTVKDLEIHYGSNTLRAATWGRGLWEYTLVGKNDYPSITHTSITSTPSDYQPKEGVKQNIYSVIDFDGAMSEVKVLWSLNSQALDHEIAMTNTTGNNWESDSPIDTGEIGDIVHFKVVATSTTGETSKTYLFNYAISEFKYCDAKGTSNSGADYITLVELNGTQKTSAQDYYGDYTSTGFTIMQEQSYTLNVELNHHWSNDSLGAWIDYNGDASFSDDEHIKFSKIDNDHKASGVFTVPSDCILDQPLRMRVRNQQYGSILDPCGTKLGEVEDYTVTITEDASSVPNIALIEATLTPNPSTGIFTVILPTVNQNVALSIYDINGKLVGQQSVSRTNRITVNQDLASGVYTVKIDSDTGSTSKKLIIK